ncbi:NAD(P)-dependent oxidoreductase [Halomicroarcula limicola]|uniref:NAD(P)-dependent oxidoreductase n=1 Tax=Haloarcula limicola TaxID=1429915 RepID=A0A8J8C408_9EURY|nr:NAD(P)-dependent oxidoreductase [Halomicroarcula limicola]MBV0923624.1 NAD(P)-dependent oxidoreductase [Halomicroarcula limicola]
MTIAVTGAASAVGDVVRDVFDEEERELYTQREAPHVDGAALDVTDESAFVEALDGTDTLLHLAWESASEGGWTSAHGENVRGTYNAFEAARRNDLDRIVVASTSHVVGMYNREDPGEMESLTEELSTVVGPEDPLRPDSYYGVAKAACEAIGSLYADRYGVDVVSLRLGWLMTEAELRATRAGPAARHRFARAMWLSPRDCRSLVSAAVRHALPTSPLVANAISRNEDRYLTLAETVVALDYQPRDDAAAVLAES